MERESSEPSRAEWHDLGNGHPADWDIGAVAQALSIPFETRADPVLGAGARFHLGPEPSVSTELELFPATGVVRLTGPDLQLVLVHEQAPVVSSTGLVFTRAMCSIAH